MNAVYEKNIQQTVIYNKFDNAKNCGDNFRFLCWNACKAKKKEFQKDRNFNWQWSSWIVHISYDILHCLKKSVWKFSKFYLKPNLIESSEIIVL